MKCILCQSGQPVAYLQTSHLGLPIYHCKNCESFMTGSSENELSTKLKEIYKEEYWNKKDITPEETLASDYTDINSKSKKRQWHSQFAYCSHYFTKNQTLLEIGSGLGQTIFWFEEVGFSVTGIEPDSRNVNLINKKLKHGKCIEGYIEQLDIEGKFDIIWISHVIEHLIRPDLLLKKLKNNLNDGGIIFIEVPNCENEKVLKDSIYTQPHTYHFSKKSLTMVAVNSGYKVLASSFFKPANIFEAIINRFTRSLNVYPYYPKIITTGDKGIDLRLIMTI